MHDEQSAHRIRDAYRQIPYTGGAYPHTRPTLLATLAWLHGMSPAPVARARVLELGCGDGGNLIPLACACPDMQLVGVDLAPNHIEAGKSRSAELGLPNLSLHCANVVELGPELGRFDYVIAHGLMSWVPPEVQHELLRVFKERLAPQGVGFVSYNIFPGWHLRGAVRDLLRAATRHETDLAARADRCLELLAYMEKAPATDELYRECVRSVARSLEGSSRHYLVHEYLAEQSHPLYFRQLVEMADRHGLQYLTEAEVVPHALENLDAEAYAQVSRFGADRIALQEGLDFVRGGYFRRSLLCHAEVALQAQSDPDRMRETWLATDGRWPNGQVDLAPDVAASFSDASGRSVQLVDASLKAALLCLRDAYPKHLPYAQLCAQITSRVPGALDEASLCEMLRRLYLAGLLQCEHEAPLQATALSERPRASRLARHELGQGTLVTSLRHQTIALDEPIVKELLPLLDGEHDRAALHAALAGRHGADEIEACLHKLLDHALLSG